jgi:hypothetical protein
LCRQKEKRKKKKKKKKAQEKYKGKEIRKENRIKNEKKRTTRSRGRHAVFPRPFCQKKAYGSSVRGDPTGQRQGLSPQ